MIEQTQYVGEVAPAKESALLQQVHSAAGIRDRLETLAAKLEGMLSRVRGSQPTGVCEDSQKNPPGGTIGELRDLHDELAQGVNKCLELMTALEDFV